MLKKIFFLNLIVMFYIFSWHLSLFALNFNENSTEIVNFLENKDPEVRHAAVIMCQKIKIFKAIPHLIDMLSQTDTTPEFKQLVLNTLKSLTQQDFKYDTKAWLKWWTSNKQNFSSSDTLNDLTTTLNNFENRIKKYEYFNIIALSIVAVLSFIVILLTIFFSATSSNKLKAVKEITRQAEKYIKDSAEITRRNDRILLELDKKKENIVSFFNKLKEENESEIERFSEMLQKNMEHRMREEIMLLRDKAEKELEHSYSQLKEDVAREVRKVVGDQKEKILNDMESKQKEFFDEMKAHKAFIEASYFLAGEKYEEALRLYKQSLSYKPDYYITWNNMGEAYKNLERINEALDAFNRALDLSPENAKVLYNIASVYAKMGNKEKMLEFLSRAVKLDTELKDEALNDSLFKNYWNNPDFKDITET